MKLRAGQGFDTHRLVAGRPLMLGGVQVPHDKGLAGHSDGDCVIHAICDALLGAAAAGDMGVHFPSRDQRWKDAASRLLPPVLTKDVPDSPLAAIQGGLQSFLKSQCEALVGDAAAKAGKSADASGVCG